MNRAVLFVIKLYRRVISPLLPHSCRFTPSCSAYFQEAVETKGVIRGSLAGIKRIFRCHPFHPGGWDPVK